ncbi:MAG TPA: alpha/beta hydrolase-fold protein [Pirellulales bacterium]|jgi:predicted esterase
MPSITIRSVSVSSVDTAVSERGPWERIVFSIVLSVLAVWARPAAAAEILVTEFDNETVDVFTTEGARVNYPLISGVTTPTGIAASGTNLFVARYNDNGNGSIASYNASGVLQNKLLIPVLAFPTSVAVSGSDLFVATEGRAGISTGTVGEYTTAGGFVHSGLIRGLVNPVGIVVSGTNLFVVSAGNGANGNGTVGEYTTAGVPINASLITGLNDPGGIALSGGNLFVTNIATGTVGEYTTSGVPINASLITGMDSPGGIAVYGSNLFITNEYIGTVAEYTTAGTLVNPALISGLMYPRGIAIVPEPATGTLLAMGAAVLLALGYGYRKSPSATKRRHGWMRSMANRMKVSLVGLAFAGLALGKSRCAWRVSQVLRQIQMFGCHIHACVSTLRLYVRILRMIRHGHDERGHGTPTRNLSAGRALGAPCRNLATSIFAAAAMVMCALTLNVRATDLSNSLALTYTDGQGHSMQYRLFLPAGYGTPGAEFPLVLFLHGSGESGTDNLAQVDNHIDGLIDATRSGPYSAFLLAPQLPTSSGFGSYNPQDLTMQILQQVEAAYPVETNRMYITGLSMGGFGTFEYISEFPHMFAAAVPLSGGGDSSPENAALTKDVPTWIFHGDADTTVPVADSIEMYQSLVNAGGHPKITIIPGGPHDIWEQIYGDATANQYGVYPWMFSQSIPEPSSLALVVAGVIALAVSKGRKCWRRR